MKIPAVVTNLYDKAKHNVSVLLLLALVILVLLEAGTVKSSLKILSNSKNTDLLIPPKLVRVNFAIYDAIVKRVQDSAAYRPQPLVSRIPFGVKPSEEKAGGSAASSSAKTSTSTSGSTNTNTNTNTATPVQ